MDFTAPAKVNLYLNLISKRDDGYHEIETLFEKISLADTVSVDIAEETTITCTDETIPVDKYSLLGKTVHLFTEKAGKYHFKINIIKRIPVAAGLGGGSSDAAALLLGMNELVGNPLSGEELVQIGSKIGADVPFFMQEESFAIGRRRGDVIKPIKCSVNMWHILINPPFEVATKDVYAQVGPLDLTTTGELDKMMTEFLGKQNVSDLAKNLHNDLQPIVLRKFDTVQNVLIELEETGPQGTLLSGSGPTVFGIYEDKPKAEEALVCLKEKFPSEEGWQVFVANTF